ncbi:MAG: DNA-directed RNA polymerase subunit N [Archaeoglobaceae archaeon]|nr:DNA-directed RNA polymerase subunit N [Archaeoglobaceae archaeon]MCX8151596.1 DNA-directed RNA polymerase subunit N [Archaeoglobaceae archaeon]MDW8013126.1 DNA-directed RNA polymerase subunit N [Archaeoglobaceae archaeon]
MSGIPFDENSSDFPIRCFSCGAVIAHFYEKYKDLIKKGRTPKQALDELGIKRYCCRRMFLTHKSIIKELIRFHGAVG